MRLKDKVAVITGSSKGIGAAIAQHFAREGARVVVNYASSAAQAHQVVAAIVALGGEAIAVQADVSQEADILRLFAEAVKAYGRVDILVNNAGIYEVAPLAKISAEHFHRHFNLNVLGLLLTTQEAVKHFPAQGGSVINVSSVVSTLAPPGTVVYNATKGAVDTITRTLAKELGKRQIRVNSINPGLVETEGLANSGLYEHREAVAADSPLGRIGEPADIAPLAVYLASSESSWTTGETFYVAGGYR